MGTTKGIFLKRLSGQTDPFQKDLHSGSFGMAIKQEPIDCRDVFILLDRFPGNLV